MWKIALKSTLAKKRRLFGTALSVMIGVAFLAGTLVFTDTIARTFDDLFAGIYDDTDSYVRSETSVELGQGYSQRGRIPGDMVATVAAVPGVDEAEGFVAGYAQIVGSNGHALGNPGQGAPTYGMSHISGALSPWQIIEGSRAPGPGEVVIDKGSYDKGDLALGDTITVLTQTGPHEFTLVGIARFGSVDSPGGASVALFDLPTAQQVLLGGVDEIDAVMVHAAPGVSEEELTANIAAVLPSGVEALTGSQIIAETQDTVRDGLAFFKTFLLVFAVIALVVACFTIYNTFQIIVTQRSREMALLRSVGATRRQVLWAQLLEAVILGVTASVIGLFAGVGVAGGLKALMAAFGIDIPAGGTVFAARTAIAAMLVGTVVTIASAVFPSMRASRVPPLAAIRDITADAAASRSRPRLIQGGVFTLGGVVAFVAGLTGSGLLLVGIGALLIFVGVFTLGPMIARPVARSLGAPIAAVGGVAGVIARENAGRNPKRTARTGGALMVGVALVVAITVIAATARDWTHDVFAKQFSGDFVVSTNSVAFGGISPDLASELNALPEVEAAAGIRVGAAREMAVETDVQYVAIDPVTAGAVFDIGMTDGSLAALTENGVLVDNDRADSRGLTVGDTIEFGFVNGETRTLTVEGIYTKDDLVGAYVVSHALHEQTGVDQFDFSVYIATADGVSVADAQSAITAATDPYANAKVQSRSEYITDQAAQIDQIVNLMYGLLAMAVIVALISIANSMSLSIHERTRELGLLRAVGMTRHQIGSAVRWEAAIVALLGTSLGAALGVCFGWALSVTLRHEGLLAVNIPGRSVVVIIAIGMIGGVIASVKPAWRAAHLDVLRAIATE